ncbi:MAG: hypothetical protein EOM80_05000 [Erysipelotrichia bacterium]|nr:hypothetical protein [Erysipelotrichia bacterium]
MIKSDLSINRSNRFNRTGGILVIAALASVFFVGMAAMVTDVGYLYYNQARLQTATNAGWKAGYDKMLKIKSNGSPNLSEAQKAEIISHVEEVISANGYTPEEADLEISFENNNHLTVSSNKQVEMFFAKIWNIDSANVNAQRVNHPEDAGGVVPLTIPNGPVKDVSPTKYRYDPFDENEEFQSGREYILKLGENPLQSSGDIVPWGVVKMADNEHFGYTVGTEYIIKQSPATDPLTPGNFGCLDLDGDHGGGANDYEDRIKYGFEGTINIGDLIYPETGNMAGPTIDGVEYRMENGLVDIRIPVVSGFGNGQSTQSEILGFLNFRLTGSGIEGKGGKAKATVRAIYTGLTDNEEGLTKKSFGRIDPDNDATNPTSYLNNFKFGFNAPLDMDDMLLPENGNAPVPTDESVEYRLDPTNSTSTPRTVIIPISDVPPEVGINNAENLHATTIYDLDSTDSPDGVYKLNNYSFGSSVRIIGFAEFELLDPSEYTREGKNYDSGDNGDLGPYQPGQVRGKFIRYIIKPGEMPADS